MRSWSIVLRVLPVSLLLICLWAHAQASPWTITDWTGAHEVALAYEVSPGNNRPPRRATKALFKTDQNTLWVRIDATEPDPASLRAHLRIRDDIDGDDAVGVMLAPGGINGAEAFVFWVSAAGVQYDAHWTEANQSEDASWDARWQSRVEQGPDGYVVEMHIPLSQLPLVGDEQQTWGIEFQRDTPREAYFRDASRPIDQSRSCTICGFAEVTVDLPQLAQWSELEGSVALLSTLRRHVATDTEPNLRKDGNVGLSLNWRPVRGVGVALTLKPDFSQIESDDIRLTSNSADVFDDTERRPFFVNASQSFGQIQRPFHSRDLGDPQAAVFGKFNFVGGDMAVLAVRDAKTQRLVPSATGSTLVSLLDNNGQPRVSDNLAIRYRQQTSSTGQFGLTVTSREALGYSNRLVGVDGAQRIAGRWNLEASWLRSHTVLGGQTRLGQAGLLRLTQRTGDWWSSASVERMSANFRADLGYVPRVNVQNLLGSIGREFRLNGHPWLYGGEIQADGWIRRELNGATLDRVGQLSFSANGTGQTQFTTWLMSRESNYLGQRYSRSGVEFALDSTPTAVLQLSAGSVFSGEIDRENARGVRQRQWRMDATWTPSNAWRIELNNLKRRLYSGALSLSTEETSELRAYYHWNQYDWVRLIAQGRRIGRQLENYSDLSWPATEYSRDWQLLYSWRPSHISTLHFFLGLGNASDGEDGWQGRERHVFVKLNIAFDGSGRIY